MIRGLPLLRFSGVLLIGVAVSLGIRAPADGWHRDVVATTFWVGEIFDPLAEDGTQVISAYDAAWLKHYGGCDGVVVSGTCATEPRSAARGFFPTSMVPLENPFYLDLPYDDVNLPTSLERRCREVPWASEALVAGRCRDPTYSLLKNRWVELRGSAGTCYGQVEDAGPGVYDDARYVFGTARPRNTRYNGAGLDVSPALNGCLGFVELDGDGDRVDWRFVEASEVPPGPWRRVVTSSPVS